jgi:hypothetical protein
MCDEHGATYYNTDAIVYKYMYDTCTRTHHICTNHYICCCYHNYYTAPCVCILYIGSLSCLEHYHMSEH